MYSIDEPETMTPQARFQEVAVILAKGYLRLKKRGAYISQPPGGGPEKKSEISQKGLDK